MAKTIVELEKVLNMLKNRSATLMDSGKADLVLKQGKGQVGKPTGIKRLMIDYRTETVI